MGVVPHAPQSKAEHEHYTAKIPCFVNLRNIKAGDQICYHKAAEPTAASKSSGDKTLSFALQPPAKKQKT